MGRTPAWCIREERAGDNGGSIQYPVADSELVS